MGLYKPGFVRQNVTNCSPQLIWGLLPALGFPLLIAATNLPDLTERMEKLGTTHFAADSPYWAQILSSCPNHTVCSPCPTAQGSLLQPCSGMCWVHPLPRAPMHTTPPISFLSLWRAWMFTRAVKIRRLFLFSLLAGLAQAAVSSRKNSGKWAPPKGLSSALSQKGRRDSQGFHHAWASRCAPPPGESAGYSAKSLSSQ